MKDKQEVPQIVPGTGVSGDYSNVTGPLFGVFTSHERGRDIWDMIGPRKRYEERYPADEYVNVVNDQNREAVGKINGLVGKINTMLSEKNRDTKEYVRLIREITFLTYGSYEND